MAKYHALKQRKGASDLETMRLWREDAERAYWSFNDPQYLANIPPDILRSYQPGTGMALPQCPALAMEQGASFVQDDFDAATQAQQGELESLLNTPELAQDTGTKGVRGKRVIRRLENIVEHALRTDGTALRHILRPYNEWTEMAVRATPLAVEIAPARGRGKAVTDDGVESTHAMHVSVQRAAFEAHPIALMLFPEKFDEQLTRKEFHPRVLEFARDLAGLYERWLQLGRTFDSKHHDAINNALREYAKPGAGAFKIVPILELMKQDKELRADVATAEHMANDPLDAARLVLDKMGSSVPQGGALELPDLDG